MARFVGQNTSKKYLVFLSCIALLGIVLIADLLWASSSASVSSPYWSSNLELSLQSTVNAFAVNIPEQIKKNSRTGKDENMTDLNATFADLPAPKLEWEEMAEAPVPRLDGAAIQIKNLLYVFAGYGNINYVRGLPKL